MRRKYLHLRSVANPHRNTQLFHDAAARPKNRHRHHVYRDKRGIYIYFEGSQYPKPETVLHLTTSLLHELADIFFIVQLANIRVKDDSLTTIIAFSASITTTVVKYKQKRALGADRLL